MFCQFQIDLIVSLEVTAILLVYLAVEECEGDTDAPSSITPAKFLQWITGQGHIPILPSEKRDFSVILKFNHDCSADFGQHDVCFPIVSACAKTITLSLRHMSSYNEFKGILNEAFFLGQEFNIV